MAKTNRVTPPESEWAIAIDEIAHKVAVFIEPLDAQSDINIGIIKSVLEGLLYSGAVEGLSDIFKDGFKKQ